MLGKFSFSILVLNQKVTYSHQDYAKLKAQKQLFGLCAHMNCSSTQPTIPLASPDRAWILRNALKKVVWDRFYKYDEQLQLDEILLAALNSSHSLVFHHAVYSYQSLSLKQKFISDDMLL
ncbi:MAG: hypothetical protein CMM80_05310 [Rhodospirillaceae bacterium]|nr:hypothetical protein [Rhodospirillaceae bacterium]